MRPISPADLASFLAIARHKSFRRAADELGCTPSALSHALRGIEERLDLRLVNRTTRSVALTEAGERLFSRVAPAFRDIGDALDDLNNFRGQPMGTLRFNASRGAAQLILLPAVIRFMALQPGVKVEIIVDGALVDMVAEGCDAGVRFGETIAQDMVAVPIGGRQRTAIVASPAFFERHAKPVTPEQLKDLPCVPFRFASGRQYAWEFERDGVELNIEVDGPLILNDQELSIQAALDGVGLAFAFEDQVADLIAAGKLVRVLEDWCPYYGGFYLYYPSRRRAPAPLRAFVDFLREGGDGAS
ncbi:LysR family transcriptional regulator [Caulobacter sp. 1776]|uniref:LysR family transcriptional regulator n=1 Tax=Caulobacter sp. 1776 TaxID=3156420 RepID=UPI00339654B5